MPLDWESQKSRIRELYLTQNMTLSEVMKAMKARYKFNASKTGYEAKLREWKFRKYMTHEDWKYVSRRERKLKNRKHPIEVYFNGNLIDDQKVKKELPRHISLSLVVEPPCSMSPQTSYGLSVCSPIGSNHISLLENLPWFQYRDFVASVVSTTIDMTSRSHTIHKDVASQSTSSANRLLVDDESSAELLSPVCSVMPIWAHLESWESPALCDFSQDMDRLSEIDMSTPRISEVDETIFSMCALNSTPTSAIHVKNNPNSTWLQIFQEITHGTRFSSVALIQSAMCHLRNCIPEKYNGELDKDILQLQDSSEDKVLWSLFGYIVYLCTNYLINQHQIDDILQWVLSDEYFSMFVPYLNTETATTEAFSYQLFRAAIGTGNKNAVEVLFIAGIDLQDFMYSCINQFGMAVKRDDIALVSLLLEHGIDVNMQMKLYNNKSAIHLASSVEMLRLLINSGADIDLPGGFITEATHISNMTPLQLASSAGRTHFVQILIEAGANVNFLASRVGTYPPLTALMEAVARGHVDTTLLLLQEGADPNQYSGCLLSEGFQFRTILSRDGNWHTECFPLQIAARNGNLQLVRLLLSYGAEVNTMNIWGQWRQYPDPPQIYHFLHNFSSSPGRLFTPLVQAIENGHLDVTRLLVQAGADVEQKVLGSFGAKPINAARGNPDLLQVLTESGAVEYPCFDELDLKLAVWRGDLELVCDLLPLGFNPNMSGLPSSVGSILNTAVFRQDIPVINALLENGADVNGKSVGSVSDRTILPAVTPLQIAVTLEDLDSAKLLCEAGADIDATGLEEINTPLQIALVTYLEMSGDEDEDGIETVIQIVDLLLFHGAQVNPSVNTSFVINHDTIQLRTPLQLAVEVHGKENVRSHTLVLKLLQLGADVNAVQDDTTAFQLAVLWAHPQDDFRTVRLLLELHADVNHPANHSQRTALQFAVVKAALDDGEGYIRLVELLLDHEADVNAPDPTSGGRTALQAAVIGLQNTELIDLLLRRGASINAPPSTEHGRTVLQAATSNFDCSVSVVQKLLDAGADVNAPACPRGGVTAMQGAAIQGHINIAILLIGNGAKVNAPASRKDGRTALEGAAEWGRLDMVQLLLNAGADSHLPSEERYKSSIKFAKKRGHIAIANLLLSYCD